MSRLDDLRIEWRISDVERKADEANRRLYEIDTLRRDVDSLECSNRQLSTTCDELRSEVQGFEERIARLASQVVYYLGEEA